MRFYISLIIVLLLLAIAFIFGSQNTQVIELSYGIAKSELTVASAVSLFTGLGFFIGVFTTVTFQLYRSFKKKRKVVYQSSENVS